MGTPLWSVRRFKRSGLCAAIACLLSSTAGVIIPATPVFAASGALPSGPLGTVKLVISAAISSTETCDIQEPPGGITFCFDSGSRSGGTAHYTVDFGATAQATVPITTNDNLQTPGSGTGPATENVAVLSGSGTYANGSTAAGFNCGLESGSITQNYAGSTQDGTQDVSGLQATRDASGAITDLTLQMTGPQPPTVEHETFVDTITYMQFANPLTGCVPGVYTTTTTGGSGAALGQSDLWLAYSQNFGQSGIPTFTGWTMNPNGTWTSQAGGVLAEKSFTVNAQYDPPSSGSIHVSETLQVVTGIAATTTLTSVASSSNPSTVGDSVTYTATVAPTPDGGTVAFTDNTTTLTGCGAVAVNTTTGKATCTTSYVATGSHAIVATYSGDASFAASSGSLIQQVNAATIPEVAVVLPAVSNGAYGGYVTAATIQNTGSAPAIIGIAYFDQNGAPVGTGDSISSLPVNASWTVRQDNGNSFPSSGGNAVQAGSAVVYSDQPVAAFVNEFAPGNVGDATSYSGVPVPSGVGTTLYAPTIVNNAYGGYTTGIGLLNEGSSPTDVTITYRDGAGVIVKTQTVPALAAQAYQGLYSGDTTLALPSGFAGTATITNSAAQPLGAIVNETGPGAQFSSYDAVPSGSTTLYAPAALNNAFGGYYTGMGIQNTTGSASTVTITYYDTSGTATAKSFSIPANGSLGVYQGSASDGPAVGAYTAVIQSTLPLAAIVNEVAPAGAGSARQSTSYNTFSAGSGSLHLPLVENAGSDPWNTGEGIMNTGTSSTMVTVNYYDTVTGAVIGTAQTQTLAPHAFWGLYQPTGGLPSGKRATAVVTTSSGGQVAVICNESSSATFMSYDGQ
jgi:hypothetical protein